MKYRLSQAAEDDLAAAALWYEAREAGLGEAFLNEVSAKLERICAFPFGYEAVERGFRKAPLDRFPYSVFYRMHREVIEVAAVFHARRDPKLWRKRLT